MRASDAERDVMNLILSTPVAAVQRPEWVDRNANWTEVGGLESRYVRRRDRDGRSPWIPIALALSAAVTTVAASATTMVGVFMVAFVL